MDAAVSCTAGLEACGAVCIARESCCGVGECAARDHAAGREDAAHLLIRDANFSRALSALPSGDPLRTQAWGLVGVAQHAQGRCEAAAAAYRAEGRGMDTEPAHRFVTASLHVDFLRPTPIDAVLELRGQVKELKGRKVVVAVTLSARGELCARGEVVCVRMPEEFGRRANGK